MSLTLDIKAEIVGNEITEDCCNAAFLSALIRTAGSLIFEGSNRVSVEIATHTPKIEYAQGLYGISIKVKTVGGKSVSKISGKRMEELLNDVSILVRIEDGTRAIIHGIDKHLIQSDCCKASYAKGAFLGSGTLSIVKKGGYHLQFANSKEKFCKDLADMFLSVGIHSKVIPHGEKHLVYIKDAQYISDLLALIGANNAVLKLNNKMVDREVGKNINRQTNWLLANLDKTVTVSFKQCQAIEKLKKDGALDNLGEDYVELARVRLNNPDMTYQELSEKLGISKSAVKYKLDKLCKLGIAFKIDRQ